MPLRTIAPAEASRASNASISVGSVGARRVATGRAARGAHLRQRRPFIERPRRVGGGKTGDDRRRHRFLETRIDQPAVGRRLGHRADLCGEVVGAERARLLDGERRDRGAVGRCRAPCEERHVPGRCGARRRHVEDDPAADRASAPRFPQHEPVRHVEDERVVGADAQEHLAVGAPLQDAQAGRGLAGAGVHGERAALGDPLDASNRSRDRVEDRRRPERAAEGRRSSRGAAARARPPRGSRRPATRDTPRPAPVCASAASGSAPASRRARR